MKNKLKINKIKITKAILAISIIISTIILIISNNNRIEKIEKIETKATNQEILVTAKEKNEENFSYVESLDHIQVPVPKGYTASSVEDEMYVNGVNEEEKWYKQEELTFTSEGTYPWSENTSNIWVSGNKNVNSSTSTLVSNNFTVGEETIVRINFSVSSQNVYDYVKAKITNTVTNETYETEEYSGTALGTSVSSLQYINIEEKIPAGEYKVEVTYTKNASTNTGLDTAYVKNIGVYTKTGVGEEITTYNRTHSGGFVIYEGEEEVNEGNLWNSQITRNQYVWIPIDEEELGNMYSSSENLVYGNYYTFTVNGYNKQATTASSYREPKLLDTSYDGDQINLKQYMAGITRYEFKREMEQRFYEMLESIATYGGFYCRKIRNRRHIKKHAKGGKNEFRYKWRKLV